MLAPYVLTARMRKPDRLVYLSSGMHTGGDPSLEDLQWARRRWIGSQAYADTKLHDVLLAFGLARRWPDVLANALTPGWVPTRMGGPGASDDLDQGHLTQAWLAVSDDPEARGTGGYSIINGDGTFTRRRATRCCRTVFSRLAAISPVSRRREAAFSAGAPNSG